MRLDIRLEALEPVGQVLDIGPRPVGLGALDLLPDQWVVRKVRIVQVPVVPEEEGGKVQGQV
jgi:hypothetical protein